MIIKQWFRVSRDRKCRVCDHGDWCGFTEDGTACCMRVKSDKLAKNGGYIHKADDKILPYVPQPKLIFPVQPEIDFEKLWNHWSEHTDLERFLEFSKKLEVDPTALDLIGCVWAAPHNAWAFPMKNSYGQKIGIRLRNEIGEKWAVKGSRQGLFLPDKNLTSKNLYVVEGPTDLAAALTMGLWAIARPSCLGCENLVSDFLRLNKVGRLVIVSDNDAPGLQGAERLQAALKVPSCIWVPPAKDMREFLKIGGNSLIIDSMIKNLVWNIPKK